MTSNKTTVTFAIVKIYKAIGYDEDETVVCDEKPTYKMLFGPSNEIKEIEDELEDSWNWINYNDNNIQFCRVSNKFCYKKTLKSNNFALWRGLFNVQEDIHLMRHVEWNKKCEAIKDVAISIDSIETRLCDPNYKMSMLSAIHQRHHKSKKN